MHSFQPSRGRTFFEVLCAFALAASFVGAWMQTGASALLAAASVAALYGLVHAFDLFRRNPTVAVEPQRIELEPAAPLAAADQQLVLAEPASRAKADRPAKAARKKKTNVTEPAPAEPVEPAEEAEVAEAVQFEEAAYISHAPLFEPAPFVRQQRAAFGRKSG